MTLLEIMVVVLIISLLMGAVGFVAFRQIKEARKRISGQTVLRVQMAIDQYGLENLNQCPEALAALFEAKILDSVPADEWGEALLFKCPAEHGVGMADVWSKGPDKQEGTADDICSWKLKRGGGARSSSSP